MKWRWAADTYALYMLYILLFNTGKGMSDKKGRGERWRKQEKGQGDEGWGRLVEKLMLQQNCYEFVEVDEGKETIGNDRALGRLWAWTGFYPFHNLPSTTSIPPHWGLSGWLKPRRLLGWAAGAWLIGMAEAVGASAGQCDAPPEVLLHVLQPRPI